MHESGRFRLTPLLGVANRARTNGIRGARYAGGGAMKTFFKWSGKFMVAASVDSAVRAFRAR
jgi:hypothetical protein